MKTMQQEQVIRQLRALNKIYGRVFFTLILLLLVSSVAVSQYGAWVIHEPRLQATIKTIAIAVAGLLLVVAYVYPQGRMRKMSDDLDLSDKMKQFRTLITHRLLLIFAAGVFTCLFFTLTGDTNLMMVLAIIILLLIMARPTPFKTATDLRLTEEEKQFLFQKPSDNQQDKHE